MGTTEIIANIICAISYVILIVCTFLNTKRLTILLCYLASCLLYGIQGIMLKAYSGAYSQFFSCLMYVIYALKGKNKFFNGIYIPIFFAVGYITIGLITWDGPLSLMPLFASLIATYSMWNGKEFFMKVLNIPISVLWITYSFIYLSYAGGIGQSIMLIFDFVYLYLYYTKYRFIDMN